MSMKQKSTSKPGSISDKMCALSTRNKGLLALLVTISAALCVVICGLILLGFGTSSVATHYHSMGFVETTCVVTNSTIAEEKMECSCKDVCHCCRSVYPCLLVDVTYTVQHTYTTATSTLYHTDVILNHKCSYEPDTPCYESSEDNERVIQQFQSEFGEMAKNYSCLYNPDDSREVIITRAATTSQIVLMMMWPSLLLVFSVIIIVAAHCYVGARNICDMFRIVNKKEAPTSFTKRTTTTTTRRYRRKPLLLHPV